MKVHVVYFSQTGNTKKVADAIAEAFTCKAESIDTVSGITESDMLFIGAAVYATYNHDVNPAIKAFLKMLDPSKVKTVAVFSTYAFGSSMGNLVRFAKDLGLNVSEKSFACKGRFLFFNPGAPGKKDLQNAKDFALRVVG